MPSLNIDDLPVVISDAEQDAVDKLNEFGAEDGVNLILILGQLDATELVGGQPRWTDAQREMIANAAGQLNAWRES